MTNPQATGSRGKLIFDFEDTFNTSRAFADREPLIIPFISESL